MGGEFRPKRFIWENSQNNHHLQTCAVRPDKTYLECERADEEASISHVLYTVTLGRTSTTRLHKHVLHHVTAVAQKKENVTTLICMIHSPSSNRHCWTWRHLISMFFIPLRSNHLRLQGCLSMYCIIWLRVARTKRKRDTLIRAIHSPTSNRRCLMTKRPISMFFIPLRLGRLQLQGYLSTCCVV
jgi:hypothetical protein